MKITIIYNSDVTEVNTRISCYLNRIHVRRMNQERVCRKILDGVRLEEEQREELKIHRWRK